MAHGKKLKSCQPPDTHLIKQPSSPYHLLHCFVMLNYFFLINPAQTLCLYIRAVQGQSSGVARGHQPCLWKNKKQKNSGEAVFCLFRVCLGGGQGVTRIFTAVGLYVVIAVFQAELSLQSHFSVACFYKNKLLLYFFFKCILSFSKKKKKKRNAYLHK